MSQYHTCGFTPNPWHEWNPPAQTIARAPSDPRSTARNQTQGMTRYRRPEAIHRPSDGWVYLSRRFNGEGSTPPLDGRALGCCPPGLVFGTQCAGRQLSTALLCSALLGQRWRKTGNGHWAALKFVTIGSYSGPDSRIAGFMLITSFMRDVLSC